MENTPQNLISQLASYIQAQNSIDDGLKLEVYERPGGITILPLVDGELLSSYYEVEAHHSLVRVRHIQYLTFLPGRIDMVQVENFINAILYFRRWTYTRNRIQVPFLQEWEMEFKEDHQKRPILTLTAYIDVGNFEDFIGEWEDFAEEAFTFSSRVCKDLEQLACSAMGQKDVYRVNLFNPPRENILA